MKKVLIGLTIAMLSLGAAGCNKDKPKVAAAPVSEEALLQVEASYQRDDPNAQDPSQALTCKYINVTGSNGAYSVSKAEIKTSGRCDFDALKGSASSAGALAADKAAQIVSLIQSDDSLSASARDKRGCTAINVRTTTRKAGAQDCVDGSGKGNNVAKGIAAVLGL